MSHLAVLLASLNPDTASQVVPKAQPALANLLQRWQQACTKHACLNGDPHVPQTPQAQELPPLVTAHTSEPLPSSSTPSPSRNETLGSDQSPPLPSKSIQRSTLLVASSKLCTCKLDAMVDPLGQQVIAHHKKIQLNLSGEDIELDCKIVEELFEPLLHIMNNAIDHGTDIPADRLARGHSTQGSSLLKASHQGGSIPICKREDGKGLDASKTIGKAQQSGLIPTGSKSNEKDFHNLLFLPGFSSTNRWTELSVCGVGRDRVRGTIHKLRRRVDIDCLHCQAINLNCFLPLTPVFMDAVSWGVEKACHLLPILTFHEPLRPAPSLVFSLQDKGEVISVRGKLILVIRLSDELGLPREALSQCRKRPEGAFGSCPFTASRTGCFSKSRAISRSLPRARSHLTCTRLVRSRC